LQPCRNNAERVQTRVEDEYNSSGSEAGEEDDSIESTKQKIDENDKRFCVDTSTLDDGMDSRQSVVRRISSEPLASAGPSTTSTSSKRKR